MTVKADNLSQSETSSETRNPKQESWEDFVRHLIPEIIIGYTFWCLFCGFGPAIWFYPLNELDITGYEVFLVVLLVPVVCGIPQVFRSFKTRLGLAFLRIIASSCIGTWLFPTTFSRLVVLAIGTGCAILLLVSTLWSGSPFQRYVTCWGLLLGFFGVLITRIWYISLLPPWADSKSNGFLRTAALFASFDHIFSGFDEGAVKVKEEPTYDKKSWVINSIGFGSLLYITVAVFGEVSLVSRWIVSGHPETGPGPNPWGAVVLISLTYGMHLATNKYSFIPSKLWWFFGSCGLFGLYRLNHFLGFSAGCMLAVYIMSLWPKMIDNLTRCPPARTATLVMMTFIVEILFSIWTVAYNFVPGGVYTREHTGYLLTFISITLLLPFLRDKNNNSISHTAFEKTAEDKKRRNTISFILFMFLLFGLIGFAYRIYSVNITTNLPEENLKTRNKDFTALIWTFHFGYDNQGLPSFERAAKVLNETGADFIALLESDASKPFLGNNDITAWISETLHMYSDFGPSTRDHTWGNLILSKYPIIESRHHLLPSPYGELAPAISATVNISGRLVDFVTTHMGNDRDDLDRMLQAQYLSTLLNESKNPVVFLGYVTSAPRSRDYFQLIQQGRMNDIDHTDTDRWCQYIMYRGLIRLGYGRISHGGLSDTELQMAKFRIPDSSNFVDNHIIERNKENVPFEQLFNPKFQGPFSSSEVNNHRFHVNTPKYFLPKKN